jgi:D-alanyl-D-alanine carboxypeptidase
MTAIDDRALQDVSAWVSRRIEADGTPGLSLAITDRDGLLHAAAFGFADLAAKTPTSTDHLFETGSIGKSFTAIALLQLAAAGKLDLHAPVNRYLPWFEVRSSFPPFTLHHLLSHTAGITSGIDFAPDAAIQVWALRESETAAEPGTFFHYSNLGYKVLGLVLEKVGGELYGPAIRRRILDPLELRDSVPVITNAIRPRLAIGYSPAYDDRPWWPGCPLAPATWFETDTADGCLAMTAADLAGYLRMLLNQGKGVLDDASFALLTQCAIQTADEPEPAWYGYGLWTRLVGGHTYVGHGGGMVGYYAGMLGDLDRGIGVTALVNGPGAPTRIARTVLDFVRDRLDGEDARLPEIENERAIPEAASMAGTYSTSSGAPRAGRPASFALETQGDGLTLVADGETAAVRRFGDDALAVGGFELDRFPLVVLREDDQIVGLRSGDLAYARAGIPLPPEPPLPAALAPFTGHYRSHNPWTPDFRVVAGHGRLWLIVSGDADGLDPRQPLVPLPDDSFRCGEDPRIPERIRFNAVVAGRALIAQLNGCDYYRVNAP